MAKKKKTEQMVCPPGSCGPACVALGLLAAAFKAGGLWMVIEGVVRQWNALAPWTNVTLWYFGGFILWCIACLCMKKACPQCRA